MWLRRYGAALGCALPLLLAITGRATAQTAMAPSAMAGTVRDDRQPLARVRVEAVGADASTRQTTTDQNGQYRLTVPPGGYALTFRLPGYAPKRVANVRVTGGATTTADAVMEIQPVGLGYVVVTATRRTENAGDTPASVSMVDERTIREHTAQTPLDFARSVPGIDMAVQGIVARQVVARGFNATLGSTLLMLTDFRDASLPSPRANLSYYLAQNPDDFERLEIVRGPASAVYGANAADGVLHFITKSPFESRGADVSLIGGGQSFFEVDGRYAKRLTNRLAFKVSSSYTRGMEWPGPPDSTEHLPHDLLYKRFGGELRADFRVTPTATAILTAGQGVAEHVIDYTPIGTYEAKNWRSEFLQLRYTDGNFFTQAYVNAKPTGGTSTSLQTGAVTLDHSIVFAAQVNHSVALGARTSLSYGVDLRRTDPQSLGTIDGRNEEKDIAVEAGEYVQGVRKISERLRLNVAVRVDEHSRLRGAVVSPRVGLTYAPRVGDSFRLSYNRAFSTPTSPQLFADILAARLDPLPFDVRAVGNPTNGLSFSRDCGGPCLASPFAPGQRLPQDATLLWPAVVQIMKSSGVDLSGIPAPTKTDVGTVLRVLDPAAGVFRPFTGPLLDIPALKPTITNSLEGGYQGFLGSKLLIDASVYVTRRQNFIAPLATVTPSAFLSTSGLATYLSRYLPAASATALAAVIGGADRSSTTPGIPLATVGPSGRLAGSDVLLSFRNVGDVQLWGADLSGEFAAGERIVFAGGYSWVSKNYFPASRIDEPDLSTNTPRSKALASIRYRDSDRRLSAELRGRYAGAFHMVDGVWNGVVKSFAVADLELGADVPGTRSARATVTVQNVTDDRHAEFYAHPLLGRLLLTRLQFHF